MAFDVYLKLDGIKGESVEKDHEGEIDLLTASFEVSNKPPATSGAGAGKPEFQDFRFTKKVDSASPQLFLSCATGKHLATATLNVAPTGGSGGPHLTIGLTDAVVTSYEAGINQEAPSEVVTLRFSGLKMNYQTQDDKGSLTGTIQGGWDLTLNKAV